MSDATAHPEEKSQQEEYEEKLKAMSEAELKKIAKDNGIDDELGVDDIVNALKGIEGLLDDSDENDKKSKEDVKKGLISLVLELVKNNPIGGVVGTVITVVVAGGAIATYYFW